MCLLITKPSGVDVPLRDNIISGYRGNSHGCGVAILKPGADKVLVKKDFPSVDAVCSFLYDDKGIAVEDDAIIHFRLASHGVKDEGNRHPFPITDDRDRIREINYSTDIAVAHNGIITGFNDPRGLLSDTQMFIIDILSKGDIKDNLEDVTVQTLLNNYLSWDKVALLSPKFKDKFIYLGSSMTEDLGCYYSNGGYKYRYSTRGSGQIGFVF